MDVELTKAGTGAPAGKAGVARPRIALVSDGDPSDRNTMSGTPFYCGRALARYCGDVFSPAPGYEWMTSLMRYANAPLERLTVTVTRAATRCCCARRARPVTPASSARQGRTGSSQPRTARASPTSGHPDPSSTGRTPRSAASGVTTRSFLGCWGSPCVKASGWNAPRCSVRTMLSSCRTGRPPRWSRTTESTRPRSRPSPLGPSSTRLLPLTKWRRAQSRGRWSSCSLVGTGSARAARLRWRSCRSCIAAAYRRG
jgi:hypothetical protein